MMMWMKKKIKISNVVFFFIYKTRLNKDIIGSQGNVGRNQFEVSTMTENDMQNPNNSEKKDANNDNND